MDCYRADIQQKRKDLAARWRKLDDRRKSTEVTGVKKLPGGKENKAKKLSTSKS